MQFTSPRNVTLASAGHIVVFKKGETRFVPPALRKIAVDQGLDPVLEEGQEAPTASVGADDAARVEAIKAAMGVILERNRRTDFDAGGLPTAKAVRAALDEAGASEHEPKDKNERVALWAEVSRGV